MDTSSPTGLLYKGANPSHFIRGYGFFSTLPASTNTNHLGRHFGRIPCLAPKTLGFLIHSLGMSAPVVSRTLAGILLALPLAGAVVAAAVTDADLARTWNNSSVSSDTGAAPVVGMDDSVLQDARRAAGEASAQGSFLKSGATQLSAGTTKLVDGSTQLRDGLTQAKDGSAQLRDGMVQLQAGTGQLGEGATKIADGIDAAVGQIVGLEAARGQILGAIERIEGDLAKSRDPQAKEYKEQLTGFKEQVQAFSLDENMTKQLDELKNGSREIANQLNVPGYGYHDGIYSATKGAQDLAAGLEQLSGGSEELLKGAQDLDAGAKKVNDMAGQTQAKIGGVQRALPVMQSAEASTTSVLAPLYAFLLAALMLLTGTFLGLGFLYYQTTAKAKILSITGTSIVLGVLGGVLAILLGSGISPVTALGIGAVSAIAVAATATALLVCRRILGTLGTSILAIVGAVVQIGLLAWVWSKATTSHLGEAWQIIANLFPLHYLTIATATLGNHGANTMLAISITPLLALFLFALAAPLLLKKTHEG